MSPGRRPTPEEREIERKNEELGALSRKFAQREQSLRNLQAEIDAFQHAYAELLNERIAELEALEARLEKLDPLFSTRFRTRLDGSGGGDSVRMTKKRPTPAEEHGVSAPRGIKELYRKVAKCIHPDLTSCGDEGRRRQELMATANRAYADGDREALVAILHEWENGPEAVKGHGPGAELIRVIRRIDAMRSRIAEIDREIHRLRDSEIYLLVQRVEDARHEGIDMLSEMAAKLDLDIARAQKRLYELTGFYAQPATVDGVGRIVRFPEDVPLGTLYIRNRLSDNYRDWERFAEARGDVAVPPEKALRLDMKDCVPNAAKHLMMLSGDDLQALFLYDASDNVLTYLQGLTELEQLYLGGAAVTSDGMRLLHGLRGLRKLYLYDTAVSDDGIENLAEMKSLRWVTFSESRMTEEGIRTLTAAMPACKVVNLRK